MGEEDQIGNRIAQKRKACKMTQKQLADRLHVTDKAVSKWERGQGYPDIKTLPQLAKELNMTVNELLSGEEETQSAPETERVVQNTLLYVDQVEKKKKHRATELLAGVLSILFLLGIFVCLICDYALNARLTWSVFPVSSIVFAWLVIAPLLWCKKNRVAKALLSLSVWIVPFLWIIERNCPVAGWLLPLGVPPALLGLAYLWVLCWLFCFTRWNRWNCGSIAMLLAPVLDLSADLTVASALSTPMQWEETLLSVVCGLLMAAVFLYIGKRRNRCEATS